MAELSLAKSFPAADEAQWRALVDKALKGADFDTALVSKTDDDIAVRPLYTRADEKPSVAVARRAGAGLWDIRQRIAKTDPGDANTAILADLEGGVMSIALRLAAPEQAGMPCETAALARALEGVRLDLAGITLEAGENYAQAAQLLQELWAARRLPDTDVLGSFGADPLGTMARAGGLTVSLEQALEAACALARTTAARFPKVTALLADGRPYHDAGASAAEEIAALLATTVAYLRALDAAGLPPQEGSAQIAYAMSADGDQFETIAKFRAARACLARIAETADSARQSPSHHITAETSARMLSRRDPYVNLLRGTVACAGAILGGADAITVLPHTWAIGETDTDARRIARNIQLILQEESALGHVSDPAAGSWYVESLTDELAHKAWSLFQGIEAEGGMAAALANGHVQAMIRETADARAQRVATGEDELTGVNAFPDLGDTNLEIAPRPMAEPLDDPAVTVEPLPLRRPAEPFERLAEASDRHNETSGQRPQIFLANLGRPADYNERARYARNLFAAGGIEAVSGDGGSVAEIARAFAESGTALVCICSSDALYEAHAAELAGALKEAGAQQIYLAGRPGEARAALREAGIDSFVHRGVDMLDVLGEAHGLLGIAQA